MVKVWPIPAQLLWLGFCGPQIQSFLDDSVFNQLANCNLVATLLGQLP